MARERSRLVASTASRALRQCVRETPLRVGRDNHRRIKQVSADGSLYINAFGITAGSVG